MILNFDDLNLSDKIILSKISEKEIYEYYLGNKLRNDVLYKCCFHKDNTASLGFYTSSSGKLIHKCFGCGAQGSVFDFVKKLKSCNYGQALSIINKELINEKYRINIVRNNVSNVSEFQDKINIRTEIIPTFRNFNKYDYLYWNKYNLELDYIYDKGVRACSKVHIKKKNGEYFLFAEHSNKNPIYCYIVDNGYKIYRPLNPTKTGKWAGNTDCNSLQGMSFLKEKGELLIITSSMKDVLLLTYMGYNAVAPNGEGIAIPEKIIDYLWACFDNIILFYDNDKAGLEYSNKYSEQLGIGNIFIPTEYEEKDISDYVEKYGFEKGKELMKKLI